MAYLHCRDDYLLNRLHKRPKIPLHVGVIGERGLFETLNELSKEENFHIHSQPPAFGQKDKEIILVIGALNKIKMSNLEKGLAWIATGATIMTTCNDMSDPSSKGDFVIGMPNHILHILKYSAQPKRPYSLGNPHPIHAQEIFRLFKDISPEKLLFVGDTIYTDIQLAEEHGIASAMILTGNTKRNAIENYTVRPDYVVESVRDIQDLF